MFGVVKMERRIITYPGVRPNYYEIDNYGNVYNIYTGKQLIPRTDGKGYLRIQLQSTKTNGRRMEVAVHRLVCWEFNGPYIDEEHSLVNHKDGIKDNNEPCNLEWCSNSENIRHAIDNGLLVYNRLFDFDEETIKTACDLIILGLSNIEIVDYIYGGLDIHSEEHANLAYTLAEIRRGKSYNKIFEDRKLNIDYSIYENLDIESIRESVKSTSNNKTDEELVELIYRYKNEGMNKKEILEKITGYTSSCATFYVRRVYAYIYRIFK
jgi:hypothetical protein